DYNGHGTNVAAQVSSRAAAFAGVSSMTTLIGVKVIGASGSGSVIGILRGVLWAADHGADVANMSLGGDFAKTGSGRYLGIVNRIFNYANKQGMLIVVAAGNDAADLDHNANVHMDYCDQPQVICVAATGPELATSNPDNSSFFTNFGRSAISVAAPGGNADIAHYDPKTGFPLSKWPWGLDFASWIWSYCSKTTLATDVKGKLIEPYALAGCQKGNRATLEVGTSQASPHVAGLAALLVAEIGPGRPQQIKRAIEQSADDLGQPGTDPYYGRGRINVARALGIQ
ncbi:MAG: S8 family serine peptidase, partial [Gemmatimonadaceae bacterium]